MFKATLLLLLAVNLFSSELKTYNIYERENRVDLMLSFDSPYKGEITQIDKSNKITTLFLTDIVYSKKIDEPIESNLVKQIKISPTSNTSIKIEIQMIENLNIVASKTLDGYGLRIRASLIPLTNNKSNLQNNQLIPTKQELQIDSNYYIVMAILIILLFVLLYLKRRVTNKTRGQSGSWLFSKNDDENIKILFRKPIDAQNSIALVEFFDNSYLIVTGTSNIVLDKFSNKTVSTEDDFQEIFEKNRKKLENYLDKGTDRLQTYKEKVSKLEN